MSYRTKIAAIDAKIAELQAKRAELEVLAVNEVDTAAIRTGDTVTATYGRGDKASDVTGVVLGVKREAGKADLFRVQIGEGFSAEVITVFGTAVKSVVPVEPVAEDDGAGSAE